MTHINLPNPVPRAQPSELAGFEYRTVGKHYLSIPNVPLSDPGFFATLRARRTRRDLGLISNQDLSALLWYSAKVWNARNSGAVRWQHRSSPSAGGIHCVDILIVDEQRERVMLYDAVGHSLQQVDLSPTPPRALLSELAGMISLGAATVLWLAADFELMLASYADGESLVWRDVGALTATVCFVVEALGLGCCPIGFTGEPFISEILNSHGRVTGVGGIIVGSISPFGPEP
jgi:SagB-type dehydrogenase family enzyme